MNATATSVTAAHASACVTVAANRVGLYGSSLHVTITRRKVKAGIRVRITATRLNHRTGNTTQSDFIDFASAEEAARVFNAQAVRWHNYTMAWAIKNGYALSA
ncbi:hypothetical protein [Streptomyces sp. NPDC002491]